MKILIVVPSLHRAGAETQAVDLANGLAKRGHVLHVFSFLPENEQKSRLDPSVRFHNSLRKGKFGTRFIRDLARVIDDESIDVVHSVMQISALASWIAIKLADRSPRNVVAIHTTLNYDLKSEIADRLVFVPVLRTAERVVFVCKHQRDYWIKRYAFLASRSVVIYNGIDTSFFDPTGFEQSASELRERFGIGSAAFVFCCIARFRPEKGHDRLLRAFAELPGDPVLVLAGDGERKAPTERLARDLNVDHRVKWLGNVSDVRPLLVASDVSVLASTAVETFSIAMLESLAMCTPMIAPRIGGLAEAIDDGRSGWIFPVADGIALLEKMRYAMEVSGSLKSMGEFGRNRVKEDFSIEKMSVESESVLRHGEEEMK
jgi:glycosyltransferase involved in cell wall biosynthesis